MFSYITSRLALLALLAVPAFAQSTIPSTGMSTIPAKALLGMPGIPPNTDGNLAIIPSGIRFTAPTGSTEITGSRILSVSVGDERVETGGVKGKIVRAVLPYGSGYALATVTQKSVGLLTIEYLDPTGEYHGAVFSLDKQDAFVARADLASQLAPALAAHASAPPACSMVNIQPNTVQVNVIGSNDDSGFPAEDRVLLYERLIQQLQSEKTIQHVYRAGDRSPQAQCAEFTVTVRPSVFTKGNQAVRASIGPLGHFIGTTKLTFHLTIASQNGTPILDEDLKKSEGSDTDSLNITKVIGKTVVKNLKKSRTDLRKTQTA